MALIPLRKNADATRMTKPLLIMPGGSDPRSDEPKASGKRRAPRWAVRNSGPARVLVASGNPKERAAWRQMLSEAGYTFSEAENGAAALKIILLGEADLVIAAVTMAKLDALELLRAARDIKHSPPIVVVALGHSEINHVYLKTAKLLGAAATFMQPFEAAEFIRGVKLVLSARKRR